MKLPGKIKRKPVLNMTSLIDVLFILIIFFTVSSTFLEQPGIELNIPEAETSEVHTTQKVVVYVDSEEKIFVNDQSVIKENLVAEIDSLISGQEDKSIVLRADSQVSHGMIISLMDDLRKNGIYKIVVSTVKPTP